MSLHYALALTAADPAISTQPLINTFAHPCEVGARFTLLDEDGDRLVDIELDDP